MQRTHLVCLLIMGHVCCYSPVWKVCILQPRYRARNFDVPYIIYSKFFKSWACNLQTFQSGLQFDSISHLTGYFKFINRFGAMFEIRGVKMINFKCNKEFTFQMKLLHILAQLIMIQISIILPQQLKMINQMKVIFKHEQTINFFTSSLHRKTT